MLGFKEFLNEEYDPDAAEAAARARAKANTKLSKKGVKPPKRERRRGKSLIWSLLGNDKDSVPTSAALNKHKVGGKGRDTPVPKKDRPRGKVNLLRTINEK